MAADIPLDDVDKVLRRLLGAVDPLLLLGDNDLGILTSILGGAGRVGHEPGALLLGLGHHGVGGALGGEDGLAHALLLAAVLL